MNANDTLILDENDFDFDIDGTKGPRLGHIACQCDVRTEVVADPALYRRYGIDGPFHVLSCPDCMEDMTTGFAL